MMDCMIYCLSCKRPMAKQDTASVLNTGFYKRIPAGICIGCHREERAGDDPDPLQGVDPAVPPIIMRS